MGDVLFPNLDHDTGLLEAGRVLGVLAPVCVVYADIGLLSFAPPTLVGAPIWSREESG